MPRIVFVTILIMISLSSKILFAAESRQGESISKKGKTIFSDSQKTEVKVVKKNQIGKISSIQQINRTSSILDMNNQDEQV